MWSKELKRDEEDGLEKETVEVTTTPINFRNEEDGLEKAALEVAQLI